MQSHGDGGGCNDVDDGVGTIGGSDDCGGAVGAADQ